MLAKKQKLRDAVDKIACETCKTGWCLLKEILIASHNDDYARLLIQFKCIEIYKDDQSKLEGFDIGWDEAWMRWAISGLAKRFAELYSAEEDPIKLYDRCLGRN